MEESKEYQVIITDIAHLRIQEIYDFVVLNSPQQADEIVNTIYYKSMQLNKDPYRFPECLECPSKSKKYRNCIVKRSFRILYKIENQQIIVFYILHSKQSPSLIKRLKTS